jgi:hypothetical protein
MHAVAGVAAFRKKKKREACLVGEEWLPEVFLVLQGRPTSGW